MCIGTVVILSRIIISKERGLKQIYWWFSDDGYVVVVVVADDDDDDDNDWFIG